MGGVVSARIRGTRIHIVTDFSECVLLGNTNCVIHTEDKRTVHYYIQCMFVRQVLPAHQCWKLVIMYACLSWLSLRCWMWKHYATCVGTIITWLECGLCKGGTVVPCVVVLTWVWNNKMKLQLSGWKDPSKVRTEINRLDGFNVFRTCLTCENPVPSEWSDIRWSWTYQFPVWFWIALMRELHHQYSSAFICVASCTQYLGSSFTKTTLSISNMKVSEIGKVTYENWLVNPYPQCLLRTVYSLLQSAWIQFSHKLLTF